MTRNDFSTIPPFLLQRAESENAHAGNAGMDEPDAVPSLSAPQEAAVGEPDGAGPTVPALALSGLTTLDPAAIAQALAMMHTLPGKPDETRIAPGKDATAAPPSSSTDLPPPVPSVSAPTPSSSPVTNRLDLSAGASMDGYSTADLDLFSSLTGYRLDMRQAIWRAVDINGRRTPIADRLFTTLAEEAFRLANRQRRRCMTKARDLTIDDLAAVLPSIRRAAATIGLRGMSAFERLEAIILRITSEASDAVLAGVIAEAAVMAETISVQ